MKNALLGFTVGALVIIIGLFAIGKLTWPDKQNTQVKETQQKALQNAYEMAKPVVIQIGDRQILSLPKFEMHGENIKVRHILAILKDDTLKKLEFEAEE